MTTPAGLPAWTRTSSAGTYGGHPEKRDYGGIGEVNPETDVSAAQFMRLCADVAAIARVAPVFRCVIRCQDTGTPGVTVLDCVSMAGRAGPYVGGSAPTGFPSVVRDSQAQVTVTFPSSLSDEFGVAGTVSLNQAHVSVTNADATTLVQWLQTAPLVFRLNAFDATTDPDEDVDFVLEVYG